MYSNHVPSGAFFSPVTLNQGLWAGGQPLLQAIQPQALANSSASAPQPSTILLDAAVEASSDVDEILVSALRKGESDGLNRLQAVESLIGVLNRSRSAWVDYHLARRERIDDLVSLQVKPTPHDDSRITIPVAATLLSSHPGRSANKSSKRTIDNHLDRLPAVPTSEPTAPHIAVEQRNGSKKFTREDKQYAVETLLWELEEHSEVSLDTVASKLASKAPHHTQGSWRWLLYTDPVTVLVWRRRWYPENMEQSSTDEERSMGRAGEPYGSGDMKAMARLVAQYPELESADYQTRGRWMAKKYPQRTWKAWAESFRTRNDKIMKQAKKYRQGGMLRRNTIDRQRSAEGDR